jgi:SAM-dependent methyltransferase
MTARQPGAEAVPDATWSPALARGLIRDDFMRSMHYCDGFTDLLGASVQAPPSLAQRFMHSPTVAALYERFWRPVMVAIMRLHGISIDAERQRASEALHLGGDQRVLDVACGPGNFTGFFADQLSGVGFVIGLDSSVAMMERAVRDNSAARAVYMRADARSLPFSDATFDVVCCFAALHLVPEPIRVLQEMIRVLVPGGRIAVMTTYGRESLLIRKGLELGAEMCGVRVFDRTTVPGFFAAAGLTEIDQQLRGISQFVMARRPERESDPWLARSTWRRAQGKAIGF